MRLRRWVLLACSVAVLVQSRAEAASEPVLVPSGPPQVVYRWSSQRCSDEFIPDAPARAFRRADGQLVLMATHRENWTLVGRDFEALKPDCRVVLSSSASASQKAGNLWIEAIFTRDGRNIAAIVSQDMTSVMRQGGCKPDTLPGQCWLNNLLEYHSSDMGRSYAPVGILATLAPTYGPQMTGRFGVFTTTNIVQGGDWYYMLAWAEGDPIQPRGNCLFRSPDPLRSGSWRAFDGRDFVVDMSRADKPAPCMPLDLKTLPYEVRSLTWSPARQRYIAVFTGRLKLPGDDKPVPGFYSSTSADLITWTTPRRIMSAPTRPREQQDDSFVIYPSLIDPESKSRTFDTLDGSAPLLFYTVHHLKDGHGTMNRDLYAVPLKVE